MFLENWGGLGFGFFWDAASCIFDGGVEGRGGGGGGGEFRVQGFGFGVKV